jgi:uncharacterized protein YifN (PemK superfamily)
MMELKEEIKNEIMKAFEESPDLAWEKVQAFMISFSDDEKVELMTFLQRKFDTYITRNPLPEKNFFDRFCKAYVKELLDIAEKRFPKKKSSFATRTQCEVVLKNNSTQCIKKPLTCS